MIEKGIRFSINKKRVYRDSYPKIQNQNRSRRHLPKWGNDGLTVFLWLAIGTQRPPHKKGIRFSIYKNRVYRDSYPKIRNQPLRKPTNQSIAAGLATLYGYAARY